MGFSFDTYPTIFIRIQRFVRKAFDLLKAKVPKNLDATTPNLRIEFYG